jgi:UDP-N-acetylmuramate--alanine ligase
MGIGGAGMSGLAELLLAEGYAVSGCDAAPGAFARGLAARGVRVLAGHDPEHARERATLVVTSAVPADHPEVAAARAAGLAVVRRAEMLAELARGRRQVAIAGTHGKSTTTAMTGSILAAAGLDPTVVVGGALRGADGNVRVGRGEPFVVEADEYDRSFLTLQPVHALVTSVDADHLDTYGTTRALARAFLEFADRVPFHGRLVWCADHPAVRRLAARCRAPLLAYGLSARAEVRGTRIRPDGLSTSFRLTRSRAELGVVRLRVPGRFNVQNAVGAAALAMDVGAPWEAVREGLETFTGVGRRFEVVAEAGGVLVVDDYAHHPAELAATLRAAREGWDRRVVALFQPHLYTRTRDLAREFGAALALADVAMVADVYPAREAPLPGVDGGLVAAAARAAGHRDVTYLPDRAGLAAGVMARLRPGDLVLTLGAGDVGEVAAEIAAALGAAGNGAAAASPAPDPAAGRGAGGVQRQAATC